jgi:ubiquinone/menaquinone biosynthesis C-methylase UbiE
MSTTTTPAVDLEAVKAGQQKMWASGDFHVIAALIQPCAEHLVDAADLVGGSRVLDVATGSGNLAIAAARCATRVTGVDYVPELLERARTRAAAEGFDIGFEEGDAEQLPFEDASFDAVTSIFGVMFAPNQERAAAELTRVARPGGTIALAAWTPEGFIGSMLKTVAKHVPPPAGVASPLRWGSPEVVDELVGGACAEVRHEKRDFIWRFASAEDLVETFRRWYGPTLKAFTAVGEEGAPALQADLVELVRKYDRRGDGGAIAVPSEYLVTTAVRA